MSARPFVIVADRDDVPEAAISDASHIVAIARTLGGPDLRVAARDDAGAAIPGALAAAAAALPRLIDRGRAVVVLDAAFPFVSEVTVRRAIEEFRASGARLCVSVRPLRDHPYRLAVHGAGPWPVPVVPVDRTRKARRQEMPEVGEVIGAVSVFRAGDASRLAEILAAGGATSCALTPSEGIEVKSELDLALARRLARGAEEVETCRRAQ